VGLVAATAEAAKEAAGLAAGDSVEEDWAAGSEAAGSEEVGSEAAG
jgi:hypothetical protein